MFVFQAVGSTPTYRIRSVRTMKIWVRRCHWTPPIGDLRFFRHHSPIHYFRDHHQKNISLGQWIGLLPGLLSWSSFELIPHLSDLFHFRLQTSQLFYSSASLMQTFDEIKTFPLKIIESSQTIMFFALKKTGKLLLFSDFTLTVFPMLDVLRRSEGLGDDWSISVDTRIPWHHGYGSWQL